MNKSISAIFILLVFGMMSCGEEDQPIIDNTPGFDRGALLVQWADNIIIPSFDNYQNKVVDLRSSKDAFIADASESSLDDLRASWLAAYTAWQDVEMFDIGKAEEIGLRKFTNIYPTNVEVINNNIENQNYNLTLPSNFAAQGFPALDYLLFGTGDSKSTIVALLSNPNHSTYLADLVDRLADITNLVVSDWKDSYRDKFVENDGASATASTDKMVNDFIFYYERFFRAGKIGIPAGVFSGSAISTAVEAPYSGQYSKVLFLRGMDAVERLFYGTSYIGESNGVGLDDYIAHVAEQNSTTNVTSTIQGNWDAAKTMVDLLSGNFKMEVEEDNIKMLQIYDELQKAVPLLKVDMLQALNIQVDFIDADGD